MHVEIGVEEAEGARRVDVNESRTEQRARRDAPGRQVVGDRLRPFLDGIMASIIRDHVTDALIGFIVGSQPSHRFEQAASKCATQVPHEEAVLGVRTRVVVAGVEQNVGTRAERILAATGV